MLHIKHEFNNDPPALRFQFFNPLRVWDFGSVSSAEGLMVRGVISRSASARDLTFSPVAGFFPGKIAATVFSLKFEFKEKTQGLFSCQRSNELVELEIIKLEITHNKYFLSV